LGDCCLAPPKAELGFGEDFEGIFEIQKQFLPAQTEVRTNLFEKISNPFGIFLLSVFFFDCPKAMDNINFPCGVGSNQKVGNFSVVILPVSTR